MAKKKQLTIDDLEYSYEKRILSHVYEIPVNENTSICYEIKADRFNLSSEGLLGKVSITKYSKETVVKTTLIRKTQKPVIQTKEDWIITVGKYGNSLLTDKYQPITLDSNIKDNYKIRLKNERLYYSYNKGISSNKIFDPKIIPAKLLNEICAPLDEQLVEMYKLLMK